MKQIYKKIDYSDLYRLAGHQYYSSQLNMAKAISEYKRGALSQKGTERLSKLINDAKLIPRSEYKKSVWLNEIGLYPASHKQGINLLKKNHEFVKLLLEKHIINYTEWRKHLMKMVSTYGGILVDKHLLLDFYTDGFSNLGFYSDYNSFSTVLRKIRKGDIGSKYRELHMAYKMMKFAERAEIYFNKHGIMIPKGMKLW